MRGSRNGAGPSASRVADARFTGDETYRRVLKAATGLFLKSGYARTRMADIASVVGITSAAVYWHFPSKEELFVAVFETGMRDFVARAESAAVGTSAMERLANLLKAHAGSQLDIRELGAAYSAWRGIGELRGELPAADERRLRTLERRIYETYREVLVDGVQADEFEIFHIPTTALSLIAICEYLASWYRPDGALDSKAMVEVVVDLGLKMVQRESSNRNGIADARVADGSRPPGEAVAELRPVRDN